MPHYPTEIEYSEKYFDDYYEYRHVILPKEIMKKIPHGKTTLSEEEWRKLGVNQSRGWNHYAVFLPEPHVLLFRRPKGTNPTSGNPPEGHMTIKEKYEEEKQKNLNITYP